MSLLVRKEEKDENTRGERRGKKLNCNLMCIRVRAALRVTRDIKPFATGACRVHTSVIRPLYRGLKTFFDALFSNEHMALKFSASCLTKILDLESYIFDQRR